MHTSHTNFEKNSLVSDTVCTYQLNSLHVNPGSREDLSEGKGDISGNVSSEGDFTSTSLQGFQSRQNLRRHGQDRQESERFQSRKVMLNDSSPYASSIQPEAVHKDLEQSRQASVDITKDDYSQNRKVSVLHEDEPPSSKEYPQNRNSTLRTKEQCSMQKKCSGIKEQGLGNEQGRAGQTTKDRSTFDKERITSESNRKISQQPGSCVMPGDLELI